MNSIPLYTPAIHAENWTKDQQQITDLFRQQFPLLSNFFTNPQHDFIQVDKTYPWPSKPIYDSSTLTSDDIAEIEEQHKNNSAEISRLRHDAYTHNSKVKEATKRACIWFQCSLETLTESR